MHHKRFGKFPHITGAGLTLAERGVLAHLYCFADTKGILHVGQQKLADELGISRSQVSRHLGSLEGKGFLTRRHQLRRGGGYRTSAYQLNVVALGEDLVLDAETRGSSVETAVNDVADTRQRDVADTRQQLQTVLKSSSQTVPCNGGAPTSEDDQSKVTDTCGHGSSAQPLIQIKSKRFPRDPGQNAGKRMLPYEATDDATTLWRNWEPNRAHFKAFAEARTEYGIAIDPDALFAAWETSTDETESGTQKRVSSNWGADLMGAIQVIANDIDDSFPLSPVFEERRCSEYADTLIDDYHWFSKDDRAHVHTEESPWSNNTAHF